MGVFSYRTRAYAKALSFYGRAVHLARCEGYVFARAIDGTSYYDLAGAYPLFSCETPSCLHEEFGELTEQGAVSLVFVTDPLDDGVSLEYLRCHFDLAKAYKQHYQVRLSGYCIDAVSAHHRRNIRKARHSVRVERCAVPSDHLDVWESLYRALCERHRVGGAARFSKESFDEQLHCPGAHLFCARKDGEIVGMSIWYEHGDDMEYHLGACSRDGYSHGVFYAMFDYCFTYFRERGVGRVNLGAGAGACASSAGLDRFKAGWATQQRPAYLCGKVLQKDAYCRLSQNRQTTCFPAYREVEIKGAE